MEKKNEYFGDLSYRDALIMVLIWGVVQRNMKEFARILRQEEDAPAGAVGE